MPLGGLPPYVGSALWALLALQARPLGRRCCGLTDSARLGALPEALLALMAARIGALLPQPAAPWALLALPSMTMPLWGRCYHSWQLPKLSLSQDGAIGDATAAN